MGRGGDEITKHTSSCRTILGDFLKMNVDAAISKNFTLASAGLQEMWPRIVLVAFRQLFGMQK